MNPSPLPSPSKFSNPNLQWKYHVFLSFRAEDTRKGFTDHIYAALRRKGIITFMDDEVDRGDVISQEFLQAIEESLSAVVILSENYATSRWCLDELQKIVESRKATGLEIFPIFYGVDPSDVRNQRRSFAEAFGQHEEKLKDDQEKVRRWKDALREIANISGWDSRDQHEAKLIEHIVETVWTKMRPKLPFFNERLVGIDSMIEEINSFLGLGLNDVRFIGIWGMGGIGKTTLARVVYERIQSIFEVSCYLSNVREVCERHGLLHLQQIILSHLNHRSIGINDLYEGKNLIRNVLSSKTVLLVLDDVSNISQLENLVGNQEWFGRGSRIIVTTRDMHLLKSHGNFENYEVKLLNHFESLQLFGEMAYKSGQLQEGYMELSQSVVQYAGGLPLALKVLGSFLCGRSTSEWEDALAKIRAVQPIEIIEKLRLSYEGLDDTEKNTFLDIACFFKGMDKDQVIEMLQMFYPYPTIGMQILFERSLLTKELYGDGKWRLEMHDLLQEMGHNIVLKESPDIGRRSRLWSLNDIDEVLSKKTGTEAIQAMVLKLPQQFDAYWDPDAFSNMCNLRLLMLSNLNLPLGLKCFSSALKVLDWKGYPLKALPLGVQLYELVYLKLNHSKIKQLWSGAEILPNLKFIHLSHSKDLTEIPDVSGVPNLQRLILEECLNLIKVHPSLGLHKKLVVLNFKNCRSLHLLPSNMEMNSLEDMILSGCSKLKKLPEFGKNMVHLRKLDLEETAVTRLPRSLGHLNDLKLLNLRGCRNLLCLPSTSGQLKSLRVLNIFGCTKFSRLPDNINQNENLEELDVSGTAIKEVPSSINHLNKLRLLSFAECKGIQQSQNLFFPLRQKFPPTKGLFTLRKLDLSYCNLRNGSIPHDLGGLASLEILNLSGNNFIHLPAGCFSSLSRLHSLYLTSCTRLQSLPELPPFVSFVRAGDCASIEPLSDPKQLWDVFAALDLQQRSSLANGNVFLNIPGTEIPPWFDHQKNCFHQNEEFTYLYGADSIVSIKVDIPSAWHSSEWSGIAVCLATENPMPSPEWQYSVHWYCRDLTAHNSSYTFPSPVWDYSVHWFSKGPRVESSYKVVGLHIDTEYNYPHLCIFFLKFCNDGNCWHNQRGNRSQLQLTFYTQKLRKSNRRLAWNKKESSNRLIIKKYGWRLLCQEEIETCSQTLNNECKVTGRGRNKRSHSEVEGQDAPTSDPYLCLSI